LDGQTELLEIVGTLDASGRLACTLDRRQEQADQDGDDPDDGHHLDESEAWP